MQPLTSSQFTSRLKNIDQTEFIHNKPMSAYSRDVFDLKENERKSKFSTQNNEEKKNMQNNEFRQSTENLFNCEFYIHFYQL